MSRMVTIAGRFVESATGLISTPWAAAIGIILLFDRAFEGAPAAVAPAGVVAKRLAGACAGVNRAALNQTPLVHSLASVSLRVHPPGDLPVRQLRQRRRPSERAISAALHGGSPR